MFGSPQRAVLTLSDGNKLDFMRFNHHFEPVNQTIFKYEIARYIAFVNIITNFQLDSIEQFNAWNREIGCIIFNWPPFWIDCIDTRILYKFDSIMLF